MALEYLTQTVDLLVERVSSLAREMCLHFRELMHLRHMMPSL